MPEKPENLEETKQKVEEIGLDAIKTFFEVEVGKLDKDTIQLLHNKAKIAIQFEREMGTSKRAVEMNYIRVFRLIAEDKAELKKYIKKAMPRYYPV